jgi:hypothetical protein
MTAAGVWTLSLARMSGINTVNMRIKTINSIDPIQSGLKWLKENYNVSKNPEDYTWGGNSFDYYYFWTVSKAWDISNIKIVDNHYWYPELVSYLALQQHSQGYWPETGNEEDNTLATLWSILAMQLPIISQSQITNGKLQIILNSGADLHIYDNVGNRARAAATNP